MRRTGWRKAKDYANRIDWKYPSERELLTWTVKAIDRNILFWACFFVLPLAASLAFIGVPLVKGDSVMAAAMVIPFLFTLFLFYKVGMEKTVFVYRATSENIEICQWQDIPDLAFKFLRVFPFIMIGIIAMSLISNPALSIAALVGPALVAVLVASVGSDSNYKAIYKRFGRRELEWESIDRAMLDLKKGILALSISSPDNFIHDHEIEFDDPAHHRYLTRIYFDKAQERQVLELFKQKMPDRATMVERSYKFAFAERF